MTTTPSTTHHSMHWLPQTQLGRWAASAAAAALGLTIALSIAFAAGLGPAESFTDNWLLTAPGCSR